MARRNKQNGLVQLRRSGSKQETSLVKQLQWARGEATNLGVTLDGTELDLAYMQANRLHAHKDLHLDDALKGDDLDRPGLQSLIGRAKADPKVSHIFAFKRDRLARPEIASEMVTVETTLRSLGLTLVFSSELIEPPIGGEVGIGEQITSLVEYHRGFQFLIDLAEQMIRTQAQLAKSGFSIGGRAPYGFQRALYDPRTDQWEPLRDGRTVRQKGCHVVWVPHDKEKINHWITMLELKERGWGYKRISAWLNEQNIPSPDAGRTRKDHGISHPVSGRWSVGSVKSLLENRTILAITEAGRRSEGRHRRTGPDGPRSLAEGDTNSDGKKKRIRNGPQSVARGKLPFEPQFDEQRWQTIRDQTAERGRNQSGIPRAKDPSKYPLSCRVIDLNCGSIMYARENGKRRLYVCGAYMNTGGSDCDNNSVDAEAMLKFTLGTLRDRIGMMGGRERLHQKLKELAESDSPANTKQATEQALARAQQTVDQLQRQIEVASGKLLVEENPELARAFRTQFEGLQKDLDEAKARLANVGQTQRQEKSNDEEIELAMSLFDNMTRVTSDPEARAEVGPLLHQLGLNIGLNFAEAIKGKKRKVRRLVGGVVAFDNAILQKEYGRGGDHHGRKNDRDPSRTLKTPTSASRPTKHPREGISFTKVNRGDRI